MHALKDARICTGNAFKPAASIRWPGTMHTSCRRAIPITCQATTSGTTAAELKQNIMRAVSGTARGKRATPAQRSQILGLLEALEALNQTYSPARSPMLSGYWALLYQAPLTEAAARDVGATTEGPFLASFQPLTKDSVRTKANIQLIDLPNNRVENVAEFSVASRWEGSLNIKGTCFIHEPDQGQEAVQVDVQFTEFELKFGSWSTTVPLTWVKPKGWLRTTYLDEDFRVGRGDKGSIFVASRIKARS